VSDAFACSVDDGRDQGEARKPGNTDAIEQWLVGDIPRNGGEGEEPDQVAVERQMALVVEGQRQNEKGDRKRRVDPPEFLRRNNQGDGEGDGKQQASQGILWKRSRNMCEV